MRKDNEDITAATIKSPGPLFADRSTECSIQGWIVELLAIIREAESARGVNRSMVTILLRQLLERIATMRRPMMLLMVFQ